MENRDLGDEFKVVEGNLHKLIALVQEDHLILVFLFVIPALLVIIIEIAAHVLNRITQTKSEQDRLERAVAKAKKEGKAEARVEFELELKRIREEYYENLKYGSS